MNMLPLKSLTQEMPWACSILFFSNKFSKCTKKRKLSKEIQPLPVLCKEKKNQGQNSTILYCMHHQLQHFISNLNYFFKHIKKIVDWQFHDFLVKLFISIKNGNHSIMIESSSLFLNRYTDCEFKDETVYIITWVHWFTDNLAQIKLSFPNILLQA